MHRLVRRASDRQIVGSHMSSDLACELETGQHFCPFQLERWVVRTTCWSVAICPSTLLRPEFGGWFAKVLVGRGAGEGCFHYIGGFRRLWG